MRTGNLTRTFSGNFYVYIFRTKFRPCFSIYSRIPPW